MRLLRVLLLLPLLAVACEQPSSSLRLATTRSIHDSGLLQVLLPTFEKKTGISVQVIPVADYKAIKLLEKGYLDVAITHDPQAERKFIGKGKVKVYRKFMYTNLLIAGPANDPAGIRGDKSSADAMKKIVDSGATFASCGDFCDTTARADLFWEEIGAKPTAAHLVETKQGMAGTLKIASERGAYVLCDRAAFAKHARNLRIVELVSGDPSLVNTYAVMVIDQQNSLRELPALQFADWLRLGDAQEIIASFPDAKAPAFHVWPGGTRGNDPDDLPSR